MINSHKVTKHACTSSWLPLAHSKHHTYHHVNVTQTVPDISPLMPMHQDPLLVIYTYHIRSLYSFWANLLFISWFSLIFHCLKAGFVPCSKDKLIVPDLTTRDCIVDGSHYSTGPIITITFFSFCYNMVMTITNKQKSKKEKWMIA